MTDNDLDYVNEVIGYLELTNNPRMAAAVRKLLAASTASDKQEAVYQVTCDGKNWIDVEEWAWNPAPDAVKRIVYAAPLATPSDKQEAEYALVKRADLIEHSHPQYGGGLFATEDCFIAAPLAQSAEQDRIDAERLVWLSRNLSVDLLNSYTRHVLMRGGDGDLSDIRTFIDSAKGASK